MDNYLQQILNHKRFGIGITSSGTTGEPKLIWRSPENLHACNEVAIHAQKLTNKSILKTILFRPFGSFRVLTLIHWQALKLKYKGATFRKRPVPNPKDVSR